MKNLRAKNETIKDRNFPDGIKVSELGKSERLFYNFSKSKFGYGDDWRDWNNDGDIYILIEDMFMSEDDETIEMWYT
jgi:hypothetical protein